MPPDSYRLLNEDKFTIGENPLSSEGNSYGELKLSHDEQIPTNKVHRPTFVRQGSDSDATLQDFEIKQVIGRGSFGKVFLVLKKASNEVFAMKSLRKDVILDSD